ncbi:vWA domain-containing protein [Haloarcula laminariae]|uniref:vWA domain-containing protein n=1 Tax=Haloarcula laminariae TaxID=2961577 RepID=UPI0021C72CD5|nr:VWA domain-containing protein [Halomicroarcula laminariae]
MDGIYTDVRPGARLDIEVEFITKRKINAGGTDVTRVLVADQSGEQFSVIATPDSDSLCHLETGATYQLSELLGASPIDLTHAPIGECPKCGGELRPGQVIDTVDSAVAAAVEELGIDDVFGILDADSSVEAVTVEAEAVDDWQVMGNDQSSSTVETPDYVCRSCARQLDEIELHADSQPVMNESVQSAPAMNDMASETVGLAAGGAKDVVNFRENVANGFTPEPEAISDEGLFYDYYFETGERTASDALFAPRYAAAMSTHPLTGDTEQYLSVGLDSTLSVSEFDRPRLDLVAVLDVSGSMSSPFDEYYYDEQGRKQEADTAGETKLAAATQSLCALTQQLHAEDRLGVVLYNHRAHVAKPLRDVGATDMPAIRRHIREIAAGGSTNMEDGFEAAMDMLVDGESSRGVERRVVFMTDMMPNTGETGESGLTELFEAAAADGIHTTFVGMGLDANAELADALSGIRGANHYFIHSADEFEQRLGDEFDYMVTPLVYDLDLELDADGYEIEAVHGSPSADDASDQLMHVSTLFPSAKEDGKARGGVILVRLSETQQDGDIELTASWTERDGSEQTERVSVTMPDGPETFAHTGVRKAVSLARYARELRAWAQDVHDRADGATGVDDWLLHDERGQHERESVPLVVPDEYARRFADLREYLADEMDAVDDASLQQELELLDTLCEHADTPTEVHES